MVSHNTNADEEETLAEPIKIRWTGKARDRLGGWALDFANADEDNGMEAYVRADSRQKTNVVINTVEEAEAVAGFMNKVIGEGGDYGRTWVNGAVDKAGQRVRREIVDAMAERGFEVSNLTSVYGLAFEEAEEPDVDVEEGDTVIDEAHDVTGNVTGVDGNTVHVEFTNGVTSATTVSGLLDESNPWTHVPAEADEEPEIRTDGGTVTEDTAEEREPEETDVDVPCEEGDRVAVEYHSAHVDRRKILVGSVKDVVLKGAPRDGEWVAMLAEIYVRPEEGHRNDRQEHYNETTRSAMRRVTWEIEEDEDRGWHSVEARNGLRWNRLNETGTETTLTVLAEDEEPPHPDNEISVAVGLRCHRCNGTSCKEVTDPETEPLTGTRWACPHCHEIDDEAGAEIGQQYEILGCKPVTRVDASWSLGKHEAVEWAASPTRWRAFTECVIKGRKATEYADEVDVTPGTVYRHVHDARETLRGGLNE